MNSVSGPDGRPFPLIGVWPAGEMTQAQKYEIRVNSAKLLLQRAIDKKVVSSANAIVRQIRPFTDLLTIGAATALSGAVAYNRWQSSAFVAGTQNVYVNSQLAVNKMLVIYGFSVAEPVDAISEITFERGATGQGGINGIASVENGYAHLETEWYLSKAVMWDPQDIVYIRVLPKAAVAAGQAVVLNGFVVEPVGITVSAPPL